MPVSAILSLNIQFVFELKMKGLIHTLHTILCDALTISFVFHPLIYI